MRLQWAAGCDKHRPAVSGVSVVEVLEPPRLTRAKRTTVDKRIIRTVRYSASESLRIVHEQSQFMRTLYVRTLLIWENQT